MWQLIEPKKERRKTNSYAVTLGRWYKVLENPVALLSVNHSSVHFHLVLNRFRFIKRMFSWFYLIKKTFFRILWHIITCLWFLGSIICHFLLFIALNKSEFFLLESLTTKSSFFTAHWERETSLIYFGYRTKICSRPLNKEKQLGTFLLIPPIIDY